VWPFERRNDAVRVGRESVELWTRTKAGLVLREHEAITGRALDAAPLRTAVTALLGRAPAAKARAIDFIVESAWLPVLPIEPGPALLSRPHVQALLLHRVSQLYGAVDARGLAWELVVEHRAGDRQGLGFALSPSARGALVDAAAAFKRTAASVQPALAWGRVELLRQSMRNGWLLWMEQDRSLVALVRVGRVHALNAGAPPVRDAAHARRLVEVEAVRQGAALQAPLVVAGWQDSLAGALHTGSGVSYVSMAAPAQPSAVRVARVGRTA
jgi:hypothetical protein